MARKPKKKTKPNRATRRETGQAAADYDSGVRDDDGLPPRDDILKFIATAGESVGKREISRAFNIKGSARLPMKRLLREMSDEGLITGNRKEMRQKGGLPPVTVLEVTGQDDSGDLIAQPSVWKDEDGERPGVLILTHMPEAQRASASLAIGDRVLCHINRLEDADVEGFKFEAVPIRKLPREKRRLLGIFRANRQGAGSIEPIDRKSLRAWPLQKSDVGEAKDGDLVRFDLVRKGRFAAPQAHVLESLGNPDDQRQISLIAVHAHGLPDDFPESVIEEAEGLTPPTTDGRTDLTDIPLITIDPPDARDHDDAVYAEPDSDEENPGGFVVYVAIADVAHYIRPGSRLDREARKRGNSVYFPDRVVPMLPEKISNDLCSLREGELRACLAVRMVFDAKGEKRKHTFMRAMMRSCAKLSYQEAQAAIDGKPSDKAGPILETVLKPLWEAYGKLAAARDKRGPLDLDLPERKIVLDDKGQVADVIVPERLVAHRLIEECMIQANVAAAQALEAKKSPVVYRAHEPPSKEKLKALREFLETLDLKLPPSNQLRPSAFNGILAKAKSLPVPELINEVVLRSQSQAVYSPENAGHFGLNLRRYAHFTSPIRRYADLIVHRALIAAYNLGDDGLTEAEIPQLSAICEQISEAERRAMSAERETNDRLVAAHLADRIGAQFSARVAGVARSGLFVRLAQTGADGFVPAATLGDDYFHYVEEAHAMIGQRSGLAYSLGDTVEVRLVEAIPAAGALRFEMLSEGKKPTGRKLPKGAKVPRKRGRRPGGGRSGSGSGRGARKNSRRKT
ncbi:MAG: ribonuclease R [Alphaproteobacteria bacterium]|nr:ribonuclease R [Alphaproteobacteria bacterium]